MLCFLQDRKHRNDSASRKPKVFPIFRDSRHNNKAKSSPPKTIYIRTIPITELDDPPDGNLGSNSQVAYNTDTSDFLRPSDSDLSSGYG